MDAVKCPYCGKSAEWVENKEVYGRNYGKSFMIWLCRSCNAYVGCHENTMKPLGTMANKDLREWRMKAKNLFIVKKMDGTWKNKKLKAKAYYWLNKAMGREFHFGESTTEDCKAIVEILEGKNEHQ